MNKLSLVAWLALAASGAAWGAEFSFGPPVRLAMERYTFTNTAIGDVDGDGRADLAVTAREPGWVHRLSVMLQRSDGTLAAPINLALPQADRGYPLAVVDLDHDARREIVLGLPASGIAVARVAANGSLTYLAHEAGNSCKYLSTGDVDGDGNTDVVCHSWKDMATIHLGDGSGGFRSSAVLRTPGAGFNWKQVRLADLSGDGLPELLLTAADVRGFFVFPNDGKGGFLPATTYSHPRSGEEVWSPAIEVLDLDGDGVLEVVTTSPENGAAAKLNVYRRGGNGYLALAQRIEVRDSPTALLAGDLDGNGEAELIAGHFDFHTLTVLGAGAAGLGNPVRYDLPGFGTDISMDSLLGQSDDLALGDLNGDGCRDLAVATYSGLQVMYGCRPARRLKVPDNDFDGDGVADVLWRSDGNGVNAVWHWADVRALAACYQWLFCENSMGFDWQAQAFGDFDGDRVSDVFWRNTSTGANQVRNRLVWERPLAAVPSRYWQVVGAGDFDGDRRTDLLWRNPATGANTLWKGADSSRSETLAPVIDSRWKVAGVGDFDGDGRADILWRNEATGGNDLWPSARREQRRMLATVANLQWKVAGVGDFNGDGKDDVVWRNQATGANDIWYSASVASRVALAAMPLHTTLAAVGDYNGDGRADLLWRNPGTGENVIWRSADARQLQPVALNEAGNRVLR